jgi:RHS repeat-associated protein
MGGDQSGANLRVAGFTNNVLNQLTSRGVPGYVDVQGSATNTATVTVNNQATYRHSDYFRAELTATNTSPLWFGVTNVAVLNNGTNADIVASTTGFVFVAQSPEAFGHDLDGNLTNDGRWLLTWDAESRLTKAESLASTPTASKRKVEWTYDYRGRRVRQTTSDSSSGSYVVTEDLKFISDGWQHIAELNATNNALVRSYVWGLDLSGTMDGAGGVGGLLMLTSVANGSHLYAYDGNGNVTALIQASDGTTSAIYEYEAFGRQLRTTGLMADENRFQFSTKRCDRTTEFELYEFRVRRADLSWLSRDPIGEVGGQNLYAFVYNDPIQFVDTDGRYGFSELRSDWNNLNSNVRRKLNEISEGDASRRAVEAWNNAVFFKDWVLNQGTNNRFYTDGDSLTEALKQSHGIKQAFD